MRTVSGAIIAFAVFCSCSSAAPAAELKAATQNGYSFNYPSSWGAAKFSTVKAQALESSTDIPDGVAPEHVECRFSNSKAELYIYPVTDSQTADFKKKYGVVSDATTSLKKLLKQKPANPKDLPLLPWGDTGTLLNARIKYHDAANNLRFVRCLCQYNSEPTPINNSDLRYSAQGLTKDDKFYLSAYLPVKAPGLPATDETSKWSKARYNQFSKTFNRYTAHVRSNFANLHESAFKPPLTEYDALLSSIHVPAK